MPSRAALNGARHLGVVCLALGFERAAVAQELELAKAGQICYNTRRFPDDFCARESLVKRAGGRV